MLKNVNGLASVVNVAVYLHQQKQAIMTRIYEIKKGRTWTTVRATSMAAINTYCNNNGYTDWRVKGMMSRSELTESQNLEVVA